MPVSQANEASTLLRLARAYGVCARLFSPHAVAAVESGAVDELAETLEFLDTARASERLRGLADEAPLSAQTLQAEYVRLFVRPDVPPYETSHAAPGAAAGKTQQLADVAGFYAAFGFQVRGERPDHIAPELEFVALTCVKEAYALVCDDEEGATTCREARATFVEEHLLPWLPEFGRRLVEQRAHPVFTVTADVVLALCRG